MNERLSESNLRSFTHSFKKKKTEKLTGKSDAWFARDVAPALNNNNLRSFIHPIKNQEK